jgi:hypothetical protein
MGATVTAGTGSSGASIGGTGGSSGSESRRFWLEVLAAVIAALVVGAISASVSYAFGERHAQATYQKKLADAATVYSNYIGQLIISANSEKSDTELLVDARAIVSTRNDLRKSMSTLSDLLDSDIDRLEGLTTGLGKGVMPPPGPVRDQVSLLSKKWPIKAQQINIEVRKLFAELGLEGTS